MIHQYQIREIIFALNHLAFSSWPMWSVLASLFVGFVAIVIAGYTNNKDWWHRRFPRIEVGNKVYCNKQNDVYISRIRLTNKGKTAAKNVTVVVEELFYGINGEDRAKNFLPFPLRWTHYNSDNIDMLVNRPYYLDLCENGFYGEEDKKNNRLSSWISSRFGRPMDSALDDVKEGVNVLKLKIYSENHEKINYKVKINISNKLEAPKAESVVLINRSRK